eukprot:51763_1
MKKCFGKIISDIFEDIFHIRIGNELNTTITDFVYHDFYHDSQQLFSSNLISSDASIEQTLTKLLQESKQNINAFLGSCHIYDCQIAVFQRREKYMQKMNEIHFNSTNMNDSLVLYSHKIAFCLYMEKYLRRPMSLCRYINDLINYICSKSETEDINHLYENIIEIKNSLQIVSVLSQNPFATTNLDDFNDNIYQQEGMELSKLWDVKKDTIYNVHAFTEIIVFIMMYLYQNELQCNVIQQITNQDMIKQINSEAQRTMIAIKKKCCNESIEAHKANCMCAQCRKGLTKSSILFGNDDDFNFNF